MKRNFAAALLFAAATLGACSGAFAAPSAGRAVGYAALKAGEPLTPYSYDLPSAGSRDIVLDILYAGVCHSDIHLVTNEHGPVVEYPYVPGHEIIGRVASVGGGVTALKPGDIAAVGSMVGSCGECEYCRRGLEQYCTKGAEWTGGGYGSRLVVNERFALTLPKGIPVKSAAPLMCAGITVWSPLKELGVKRGDKVAVAGLGGLGHLAVKFAASMGAEVTVFEITDAKRDSALKLGASDYVNTAKDKGALAHHRGRFDAIISTIPAGYELQPYIDALKPLGTIVILGMPPLGQNMMTFDSHALTSGGKRIIGSSIGGMQETREMLEYCAQDKIYPDVEVIPADKINEAFRRVKNGDVMYRFVIDSSTLPAPSAK